MSSSSDTVRAYLVALHFTVGPVNPAAVRDRDALHCFCAENAD